MNARRLVVPVVLVSVMAVLQLGPAGGASAQQGGPPPKGADAIALAHVAENASTYGLSPDDVAGLEVTDVVSTQHNGLTNVYLQQRLRSLEVFGALTNVTVDRDGVVRNVASRFFPGAAKSATAVEPKISDIAAASAAARALGLSPSVPFRGRGEPQGPARERELAPSGIARGPISTRLLYQPRDDGALHLAWELSIELLDSQDWWQMRMDAATGEELGRNNLVAHVDEDSHSDDVVDGSTYRVFAPPVEAPTFGGRTLTANPSDDTASPFGWHDTNGAAGPEFTITKGNNVDAYTDVDANNAPDAGSQPDGTAGLDFDFPLDLTQAPSTYRPAAVTNLYSWNNHIHDALYAYGFDEVSGNFQTNNYGRGGTGNDAVRAEAQDGGGINNANFLTLPDGQPPRMQMFLWNQTTPQRDGDFDNGVIAHEYAHGLSNRLTGGPSNTSCLSNAEQAGEGWSDYVGLILTMEPGDAGTDSRGIGTYVLGQPTTGPGIRAFPYSTSMATDPRTYDTIKTSAVPHGVGSVFAAMLWEMTWELIGAHGFDPDLVNGTGGNNIAMQLVVDGMKLQPCSPGFVDARNAILLADDVSNGGANECLIWKAFAKRGLGASASQGSAGSATDGAQAFDLPSSCMPLGLTKTANPSPVGAGGQLTYTLTATNQTANALTGVSVSDPVPAGTTYVNGSATCSGSFAGGTVTFPIGTLAAGASQVCTFAVVVDPGDWSTTTLEDGFESGAGSWTISHGAGTADWGLTTDTPHDGTNAMLGVGVAAVSDQYLALTTPIAVQSGDVLRFWHRYQFETGFDGGVVEASTNGTTWTDLGPSIIQEGYDGTMSSCCSNPLGGRQAYTGNSGGYLETLVDLSALAGNNVQVRFRVGTDSSVAGTGWTVDDVHLGRRVVVDNTATGTADGALPVTATAETLVVEPTATVPGAPQSVTATPASATSATVSFSPPASDGGSPITSYQAQCTSTNGGTTRFKTGAASPITVSFLTTGSTYRCRVRATNAIGTGPYSAYSATFVPQPPATVPGAPQSVTAAPASATSATVSFSPPASDGGSPITSYQAQCTSTNGGTTRFKTGAASPITVSFLTTGSTYRCRVRATNAVGTGPFSAYSATFVQQPPTTVPGAPQGVGASWLTLTSASVSFAPPASDGGSPITSYQAQCTSTDGGISRTNAGATSPRTVSGLTAGRTYQCRVRATNAVGTGPFSAFAPATKAVPSVPLGVVAKWATSTSATVSFSPPATNGGSAVTSYTAQCTSSDGGTTRYKTAAASPLTVTSMSAGKTYQCRVRARNVIGAGPYSGFVPVALAAPGVPRNVSAASASPTSATVSFTAPAANGGSTITGYTTQCSSTDGGNTRFKTGAASPLTVTAMSTGKTYRCRVRATNAVGSGPYSAYTGTFVVSLALTGRAGLLV